MPRWTTIFENRLSPRLLPEEEILAIVENLYLNFWNVPLYPAENRTPRLPGALALTNRRLVAVWKDGKGYRWFHIPALNWLSERTLRSDKPNWPYQAHLMIPGGVALVVEPHTASAEQARQLALLLNRALVTLSIQDLDDDGALAAIIAHQQEEERRRRRQQS